MRLRDGSHNRQRQPAARIGRRITPAMETLKQQRSVFRRNADAGVLDA
jgi:hypothetical protein